MIQKKFAEQAVNNIKDVPGVLGLAAGGSWIANEIDDYSDLDLVLVTETKISGDKNKMLEFANQIGNLINAFTGEHVGEPRVLICLYDYPLLHVDIKFVSLDEFMVRVENPSILWEKDNKLSNIINSTKAEWPGLDFQWIEDRFWTWIHYACLKTGRGEYFEALDFMSFLRVFVISPLLQLKNGQLPRGLRKIEFNIGPSDLKKLKKTVPEHNVQSIISSLENVIEMYLELKLELFPESIISAQNVQNRVMEYFEETKLKVSKSD